VLGNLQVPSLKTALLVKIILNGNLLCHAHRVSHGATNQNAPVSMMPE
jgi:hypothetical protein